MRNLWDVVRCGMACGLVVVGLNFVGCAQPSGEGEPAAATEEAGDDHDHGEEGHDHAAEGGEEVVAEEVVEETAEPEGGSSTDGDAGRRSLIDGLNRSQASKAFPDTPGDAFVYAPCQAHRSPCDPCRRNSCTIWSL